MTNKLCTVAQEWVQHEIRREVAERLRALQVYHEKLPKKQFKKALAGMIREVDHD